MRGGAGPSTIIQVVKVVSQVSLSFVLAVLAGECSMPAHGRAVSKQVDSARHPGRARVSSSAAQSEALVRFQQLRSSIPLTIQALGHFDTDCSDPDPDIPVAARGLITSLKHQLRHLIGLTIESEPDQDAAQLKEDILTELSAMGVRVGDPESNSVAESWPNCRFRYGTIYDIEAEQPNHDRDLIAVTISLGVVCGEDVSLYLFERGQSGWRLALVRESNGYKDVSGAQGSLKYVVSPRDSRGCYFVVSANINPWCTSNWQSIRYVVERPGRSTGDPVVILSGQNSIFLRDEPFTLTATLDSFRLEFSAEFTNDTGRLVRRHVLSYRVRGNQAVRVAPIALQPEDFVDEWITLPWKQASQWSSKSDIQGLKVWHGGLRPIGGTASLGEVDFVRQCSDKQWQIGMSVWNAEEFRGRLPEEIYFTVIERDGAFYLDKMSTTEDTRCH